MLLQKKMSKEQIKQKTLLKAPIKDTKTGSLVVS